MRDLLMPVPIGPASFGRVSIAPTRRLRDALDAPPGVRSTGRLQNTGLDADSSLSGVP